MNDQDGYSQKHSRAWNRDGRTKQWNRILQ